MSETHCGQNFILNIELGTTWKNDNFLLSSISRSSRYVKRCSWLLKTKRINSYSRKVNVMHKTLSFAKREWLRRLVTSLWIVTRFPSFHISSAMLCCDVLTKEDLKDQKCFNIARGGLGLMAGLDNGTKRRAKGTVINTEVSKDWGFGSIHVVFNFHFYGWHLEV